MQRIIYILLSITLILSLFSCADHLSDEKQTGGLVDFEFIDEEVFTKGKPVVSDSEIKEMKVYAYYTGNGANNAWSNQVTTATPNFMNDLTLTQTSPKVWRYPGPIYWPIATDANISFFAYTPAASTDNGVTLISTTGIPKLRYSVPVNSCEKQPDLMVAVPLFDRNISNNGTSPVKFMMKHALTCVGFQIKGSGEKITGISIKGVKTKGTVAMNGSAIDWNTANDQDVTIGLPVVLSKNPYTATSVMSSDLLAGNGYLMMIPQTLDNNAKVVINIQNKPSVEISLNSKTWMAGKKIVYSISLQNPGGGADLLYLDTNGKLAVGAWGGTSSTEARPVNKNNILCSKFGGITAYSLNGTRWSADQLKFFPLKSNPNVSFQSFTFYINEDWELGIRNISDSTYHKASNIRKGKGDICKLVGLTASEIKAMSDDELNTYKSGWRIPTPDESKLFTGFEGETSYTSHWLLFGDIYGGFFPKGSEVSRANFLPAIGYRADNGDPYSGVGQYWLNTVNDNPGDASMLYFNADKVSPAMKFHAGKALPVRCVRGER